MRITIYGGSFNPVHNGHIRLAEYVLSHTDTEQLWFVVSPRNPLKESVGLADDDMRLTMARLAVKDMPDVRVSDIEFTLPKPSFTANTLTALSGQYPEHTFSLLIGADNMAVFDRWRNYEAILARHTVYVYPRAGYPLSAKYPQMRVLTGAPLFPYSSTEIRAVIGSGGDASSMLPPEVMRYIARNNLYTIIL